MKTYLALGDSYTIGEQILPEVNFPNQTTQLLNDKIAAPEIIASTGWTTDELDAAIDRANISKYYDFVTLLIGVNNQYRDRSIKNFEAEFENLLQRSIQLANNKPNHIFVLSIPDWGVTPFAEGKDCNKIAREIDRYNEICKAVAEKYRTHYIDITTSQRSDGHKDEFLAPDKLHPSVKEYAKWAAKLAEVIKTELE